MSNLIIYLLKVSAVFSLFTLTYIVFFRKLTFHGLNRIILLLSIPLSFLIPVLNIDFHSSIIHSIEATEWIEDEFFPVINEVKETTESASISFWPYLQYFYGIGLLVYLLILIVSVCKLFQYTRSSVNSSFQGYSIVKSNVRSVFSCFKWIFVPENQHLDSDHPMMKHELAHIRLKHSVDLLATELFIAITWFNPFVFLFRRLLRSVHEFQADEQVIANSTSKSEYLSLMLKSVIPEERLSLTSSFGSSNTMKIRVEMLAKKKSKRLKLGIYSSLIPVLMLSTMAFKQSHISKVEDYLPEFSVLESDSVEELLAISDNAVPSISPIKDEDLTRLSSGYGYRIHPIFKVRKFHSGVDFAAPKGTNIYATADGIIVLLKSDFDKFGKHMQINHGNGVSTFYAHMDGFEVQAGQKVKKGDIIGFVGNTGKSTAPHLHYEVIVNGEKVNPVKYMKPKRDNSKN
ncbi:peptidoglycan DD-metalloendopeptidase family protein [Reichenbachiella versicolor]|uniref:peptidoglycan DD-metalloendopeptidase family protein n=1 Tax=Reichenbachiella versicolor TaxID=1821036 RepID=UPI001FE37F51|nr:peptidoglycan DD-metalloendopeptidase family protein [Reichenbachiella versicolor]